MKRGYQLPFYADLSRMPEAERNIIWGMMVGEEAKTKIPIYKNYNDRGFDPSKHMLQNWCSMPVWPENPVPRPSVLPEATTRKKESIL